MLRVWRNVLARAKMKLDIGTLWNLLDTGCCCCWTGLLLEDHYFVGHGGNLLSKVIQK